MTTQNLTENERAALELYERLGSMEELDRANERLLPTVPDLDLLEAYVMMQESEQDYVTETGQEMRRRTLRWMHEELERRELAEVADAVSHDLHELVSSAG